MSLAENQSPLSFNITSDKKNSGWKAPSHRTCVGGGKRRTGKEGEKVKCMERKKKKLKYKNIKREKEKKTKREKYKKKK